MNEQKPSKSEAKRRDASLKQLGDRLIELDAGLLEEAGLDERLLEALADLRRFRSHEARRRQRQYVGRLLRGIDVAPIQALLTRLADEKRRGKRLFADAERWRERLLTGDSEALDAFISETGRSQETVRGLLEQIELAATDRQDRTLRRQLFRAIHTELAASGPDR